MSAMTIKCPNGHSNSTTQMFCGECGLHLVQRWATWDREPFADVDYAVSVHRR